MESLVMTSETYSRDRELVPHADATGITHGCLSHSGSSRNIMGTGNINYPELDEQSLSQALVPSPVCPGMPL